MNNLKIKVELQISESALHNADTVSQLMMAITDRFRKQEPELYQFIWNLGYQCCEAEQYHNERQDPYDY